MRSRHAASRAWSTVDDNYRRASIAAAAALGRCHHCSARQHAAARMLSATGNHRFMMAHRCLARM